MNFKSKYWIIMSQFSGTKKQNAWIFLVVFFIVELIINVGIVGGALNFKPSGVAGSYSDKLNYGIDEHDLEYITQINIEMAAKNSISEDGRPDNYPAAVMAYNKYGHTDVSNGGDCVVDSMKNRTLCYLDLLALNGDDVRAARIILKNTKKLIDAPDNDDFLKQDGRFLLLTYLRYQGIDNALVGEVYPGDTKDTLAERIVTDSANSSANNLHVLFAGLSYYVTEPKTLDKIAQYIEKYASLKNKYYTFPELYTRMFWYFGQICYEDDKKAMVSDFVYYARLGVLNDGVKIIADKYPSEHNISNMIEFAKALNNSGLVSYLKQKN